MRQEGDRGLTRDLCAGETRPPRVRRGVCPGLGSGDASEWGPLSSPQWKENKEVAVYV